MDVEKNDIVELTVESLGYNGEGVARIDRVPVFIAGALAHERVRAVIILVKKDFLVGKLLEIIVSSPLRVQPECAVFGKCGGCDLQHLDYTAQLDFKRTQVKSTLKKIAGIDFDVSPCRPSARQYGCRNKLSLPVRNVGGVTKIGFYAASSHRIIETDECPLQSARAGAVLPLFKKWMEGQSAYDEEKGSGAVRHLSVRELDGHLAITVVSAKKTDLGALDKLLAESINDYSLYLNINSKQNNVIFGDKTTLVGGEVKQSQLFGLTTYVHPMSFLQVNEPVASEIYAEAASRLAGSKHILDAYSGGGMLTAILSRTGAHVTGVEIVPEAVESARKLALDSNIKNVTYIMGDCAAIIPRLAKETAFDAVVLDPPRQGCDEKVIQAISTCGAQTIIYISCNPATLARDISRLSNYELIEAIPFDMFPQTKHVEALICLKRK